MNFVVCAYYTIGTPYEKEVKNLEESCNKLNLEVCIRGLKPLGSWDKNTGLKPLFILWALDTFRGKNVLYVDADAVIRRYPNAAQGFPGDVAVHYRRHNDGRIQLLSSTIIFTNNENQNN